jgi:hypothetical protein
MSEEEHPEATCEECGRENVTWFAPNPLWNLVVRDKDKADPMLCPLCFIRRAEKAGFNRDAWAVWPESWPTRQQPATEEEWRPEVRCIYDGEICIGKALDDVDALRISVSHNAAIARHAQAKDAEIRELNRAIEEQVGIIEGLEATCATLREEKEMFLAGAIKAVDTLLAATGFVVATNERGARVLENAIHVGADFLSAALQPQPEAKA